MKSKLLLSLALFTILLCIFTISVSAISGSTSDEFSQVTEIEGMTTNLSDKTSRVVLKNADNTYSTYYTYYIAPTLQWQGTSQYDFTALSQKTGESYTMNSIVRIEIMTDSTILNNNGGSFQGLTNLVEVVFPKGTKMTKWCAQQFKSSSLKKINIPASLTTFGGINVFEDCKSLTDVTFDEGFSLTTLPAQLFNGCKALEVIYLPESVTHLGASIFVNCTSLRELHLGMNVTSVDSSFIAMAPQNICIYAPACFLSSVNSIGATFFSWASNEPKRATLFLTGDKSVADAFVSKASHVPLKNATLFDWDPTKEDSYYHTSEDASCWNIVYNYSVCNAFYGGEHINGELTHYDTFLKEGYHAVGCTRLGCIFGDTTVLDPIFKSYGYSKKMYGDTLSFTQGFGINHTALEKYNSLVSSEKQISAYGVLAVAEGKITDGSAFIDGAAKDGVRLVDYSSELNKKFDLFEMKIGGIIEGEELPNGALMTDAKVYLCAYIIIGDTVSYISNNQITSELTGAVSYSEIN